MALGNDSERDVQFFPFDRDDAGSFGAERRPDLRLADAHLRRLRFGDEEIACSAHDALDALTAGDAELDARHEIEVQLFAETLHAREDLACERLVFERFGLLAIEHHDADVAARCSEAFFRFDRDLDFFFGELDDVAR